MIKRRSPGQIRDAITTYLSAKGRGEATVSEIREAVEDELDGGVAPSSIRSYLQKMEGDGRARRTGRGRYVWARK
jgi:hypothetical protein